jgi:sensor histidine kinase YesM
MINQKTFIMKAKTFFFFFLILFVGIFSASASRSDTVWTSYHWDGYKVSILGGDLYHYMQSKVKITADNPNEEINVSVNDGTIKKIDQNYYYITPGAQTYLLLSVNKKTFQIQVFNIPEPEVFLAKDTHKWKVINSYGSKVTPISKEDFLASSGIEAYNKFEKFRVISFTLTFNNNGDLVSMICYGDQFNDKQKKAIQNAIDGQQFYLEDIKVLYPDGRTITLMPKNYQIIDSYENEFIRQTVTYKPYTYDLGLLHSDLRIKIEGHPTTIERQAVVAFADTLSNILQTIDVSMVDYQPSLTIIFDSVNDSLFLTKGYTEIPGGYLRKWHTPYFPLYLRYTMIIKPDEEMTDEEKTIQIQRNIFFILGNFSQTAPDNSLISYHNFSSFDRNTLKILYAAEIDGEYTVNKIIDKDFDYPDRTSLYVFLLLWTLIMSFVFIEIYKHYGIHRILGKMKIPIIVRIIESFLLAQIPALGMFLILIEHWREFNIIVNMEIWLVPMYLLWGMLFMGVDSLLKKIKKYWLRLLVNSTLSFFAVLLTYQIIFLFITPQRVDFGLLDWRVSIIPFILTLYRLIISFQQNRINTLLQEKELELSKQKELKFRSDLNALQARINPHFLYNALNSIASLSHIDANRTEKMALSLSKLFRYNTNKENEVTATLKEEVEMAEVYLEVEKHRFDDRLQYSIELEHSLQSFIIPKFILQPLVENAVKHGVSKITTQGIIKIHIFESAGKVLIEVSDNGPAFPDGLISGYGLQNTYEKLKLLYNKSFDIEFINQPEKKIRISLTK